MVRIAIVGDYGTCTERADECEIEAAVARAILRDNPDFVIAVGDLNYNNGNAGPSVFPPPSGSRPGHISQNNLRVFPLGAFSDMSTLPPPKPAGTPAVLAFPPQPPDPSSGVELYEAFIDGGRFFPTWGNHEYHQQYAQPAVAFFDKTIPYLVEAGPFAIVAVDSNQVAFGSTDPDSSAVAPAPDLDDQIEAVVDALAPSDACWKAVFVHHPPVHNGVTNHSTTDEAVIEFINDVNAALITAGSDALDFVFSGHVHALELAERNGTYFALSGSGGRSPADSLALPERDATRVAVEHDLDDNGYILLQILSKPYTSSSSAHVSFRLVSQADPSATPWHARWSLASSQVLLATKEACEAPECSQNGTCIDGSTPTPIATYLATQVVPHSSCDQDPNTCPCRSNPTGCSTLRWIFPGRPNCGDSPYGTPMPRHGDNLMRVRITAPACGVGVCTICCPVRAVARNQVGAATAWICLSPVTNQFGHILYYEGTSDCIFDTLTAPTKWTIESQASTCATACSGNGVELMAEYTCCGCSSDYAE